MENDFIKLYDNNIDIDIIEVKIEQKKVPKRVTVIYELAPPKDENFSKEINQEKH